MKLLKTQEAVGQVLCHDITEIVPNVVKGVVFSKGHVIRAEDIEVLLRVGKSHVYIWENDDTMLHENEAAEILRDICKNNNMEATAPKEGKIELIAQCDGLFLVDLDRLRRINALGDMMIATRTSYYPVKVGDKLCGTRVIPLCIHKDRMELAKNSVGNTPLMELKPLKTKKFGVINTGSELFHNLIEDKFTPVLISKLEEFNCTLMAHKICDDDPQSITTSILEMKEMGAEMIFCTGGMSVDPDDRTPLAIKNTGARIVSYGAPVLPGAMFLMSYFSDGTPVCGLPGCVMYAKRTIFDLILPLLLADVEVTESWLSGLGHGGLCLSCPECHFPNCGFGKGI